MIVVNPETSPLPQGKSHNECHWAIDATAGIFALDSSELFHSVTGLHVYAYTE